jgi:hypothetical protein
MWLLQNCMEVTANAMLDGVLVCDLAGIPALALRQQVLVCLVVHLDEAGLQLVLPTLLLEVVYCIEDLPECAPLRDRSMHVSI